MKTSDREILKGYFWNHDAIRKDVARLQILSKKAESYTEKGFEKASEWLNFHKFAIVTHHEGEDIFFFPKIAERTSAFQQKLAKFDDEHKAMDRELMKLESLLEGLATESNFTQIDELHDTINSYGNLIENHLTTEEEVVERALSTHFTKEEALAAEKEFRESMPREKMAKLMPWMVDAMDEKDRKFFFSQIPFGAKVFYHVSLKGKFRRLTEAVS